jgi:ribosomal protein S18 acetylase RimI-like enzyme
MNRSIYDSSRRDLKDSKTQIRIRRKSALKTNKQILIRRAELKDTSVIAQFNAAMGLETESLQLNFDVLRKGVEDLLADATKGFYLVAEIDGQVVGQLMITFEWSDWRDGFFWWIQSVYVLPEHRNSGVFKAIYKYIYEIAAVDKNVCGLRLYVDRRNERAKRAYESLGMSQSHYDMYEVEFRR